MFTFFFVFCLSPHFCACLFLCLYFFFAVMRWVVVNQSWMGGSVGCTGYSVGHGGVGMKDDSFSLTGEFQHVDLHIVCDS